MTDAYSFNPSYIALTGKKTAGGATVTLLLHHLERGLTLNREYGRFSHGGWVLSHGYVKASYSVLPFDVANAGYMHSQEAVLL
jgi:hypothetical protein